MSYEAQLQLCSWRTPSTRMRDQNEAKERMRFEYIPSEEGFWLAMRMVYASRCLGVQRYLAVASVSVKDLVKWYCDKILTFL